MILLAAGARRHPPDLSGKIAILLPGAPRSPRDDFFPAAEWDSARDYRDMAAEARHYFLLGFAIAQHDARPALARSDRDPASPAAR